MEFSIIIPLFNKRETIERAVRSAMAQTHSPLEIIVVDDESTDESLEFVLKKFPNVRLIKQKNAGPAVARNTGANVAIADYLVFLDADEELSPENLREHNDCLSGQADVNLSIASFRKINSDGNSYDTIITGRIDKANHRFAYIESYSTAAVIDVVTSSICVSRKLFERIGGFDPVLRCWEITDFLMRAQIDAVVTGLHTTVSAISYEIVGNSQFVRTRRSPDYLLHFGLNIAKHLPLMPGAARAKMLQHAWAFAYALWSDGFIAEYKILWRALVLHDSQKKQQGLVYFFGKLPVRMLKVLYQVRQLRHAITG